MQGHSRYIKKITNYLGVKLMSWHLDKNVTVAVIVAIIFNTVGFIWGAAQLSKTVTDLSGIPSRMTQVEKDIIAVQTEQRLMRGLMGEFKQTMTAFNNTITRIDREQSRRTPMIDAQEQEMNNRRKVGG